MDKLALTEKSSYAGVVGKNTEQRLRRKYRKTNKGAMRISSSGKLALDVHSYPNGLYIARLDSDDGTRIKSTFVVNR